MKKSKYKNRRVRSFWPLDKEWRDLAKFLKKDFSFVSNSLGIRYAMSKLINLQLTDNKGNRLTKAQMRGELKDFYFSYKKSLLNNHFKDEI